MTYNPNRPGRIGESTLLDLPCPSCGHRHLLCYLLTDEQGRHQHTQYVCTYWGAARPCGWHGWTMPAELNPRVELDQPASEWVGALVRLKGDTPEGHDRIGTVQRLDGDSWAVVAGQFTQGYTRRYPLAALERIQITVLP